MTSRRLDSDKGPLFVPVKLLDSGPVLVIIRPQGYRIPLIAGGTPVALRHVLRALDERDSP